MHLVTYNICFYSSIIFISNIIIAYYYEYYVYSLLFTILLLTSLLFHSNNNIYTLILDKLCIFLVVLYGGYLFYKKINNNVDNIQKNIFTLFIFFTFILTIYLYYYGYCNNKYCFCEDKDIANKYHSLLHIISSFGHNLIIIM